MNEINDRFADITDIDTIDGVAIRVWFLSDGRVYEERENRSTTEVFSRRYFDTYHEEAWGWREIARRAA